MSHNSRKGNDWEVDARDELRKHGLPAYRPKNEGFRDVGDIHGISPFIGQAKNWKDTTDALRVGVSGAVKQAEHAGEEFGVAFIKRARKSPGEGYAVMRISDFARFLKQYRERS